MGIRGDSWLSSGVAIFGLALVLASSIVAITMFVTSNHDDSVHTSQDMSQLRLTIAEGFKADAEAREKLTNKLDEAVKKIPDMRAEQTQLTNSVRDHGARLDAQARRLEDEHQTTVDQGGKISTLSADIAWMRPIVDELNRASRIPLGRTPGKQ